LCAGPQRCETRFPYYLSPLVNILQGIKGGLESVGFTPEIKDLDFFQDDHGLEPAAGEEDDSDEDDDESLEEDGIEAAEL
jgi:hypothetical protein